MSARNQVGLDILAVLSDGMPHTVKQIREQLTSAKYSDITNHLHSLIRRKMVEPTNEVRNGCWHTRYVLNAKAMEYLNSNRA